MFSYYLQLSNNRSWGSNKSLISLVDFRRLFIKLQVYIFFLNFQYIREKYETKLLEIVQVTVPNFFIKVKIEKLSSYSPKTIISTNFT